ncbi:LppA family lipoprotein [Amycolatopsis speibonae]|uniref:LppA family lipoprotein n=1 Tax=Amycolatopsis speibonae TaxID=1450224 RepID=A0ABV7P1U0_9PSEU
MTHRPRTLITAVCTVGLIALSAAACTDPDASGPGKDTMPTQQQQFATLLQRPDIDQALTRHNEMRGKIRDALTSELPTPPWKDSGRGDSVGGCARSFPNIHPYDGQEVHPASWVSAIALTPEQWAKAKTIITESAAPYGFTTVTLSSDKPGNYQFNLTDKDGAELAIGADKALVMAITTSCHLTAEAHRRGTPRSTEPGQ